LWVPDLEFDEKCVLDAVAGRTRTWKQLAPDAKNPDWSESKFRSYLKRMVDRGLLRNDKRGEGYYAGQLAEAALAQYDTEQASA